MTADLQRHAIWRDAIHDLSISRQQWIRTALWLFVAHALLNIASISPELTYLSYVHAHPQLFLTGVDQTADDIRQKVHALRPVLFATLPRLLLDWAALYIFSVFFWEQKPIERRPDMNLQNFVVFFIRNMQVIVTAELFAFLPFLIVFGMAVGVQNVSPAAGKCFAILASGVFLLAFSYWFCRYVFATMLALTETAKPMRVSRKLSRGKVLRIFAQGCGLIMLMLPFGLCTGAISWSLGHIDAAAPSRWIVEALSRIAISALAVLGTALTASFMCAFVRYFYNEKREADPRFSLSNPS